MLESIMLGILQGLTEFLPVSSSGHLVLAQSLLSGFDAPPAVFDVLLHGGTLGAVLVYFRRDLAGIAADVLRPSGGGWRLPLLLAAGTVPAALVGLFLADAIEPLFSSPAAASTGLLFTGVILLGAWFSRGKAPMALTGLTLGGSILIGIAQALAVVPGISRSGATIAAGMLLGLSGREAARFSFLLSIPAIAGAVALESGAIAGTGVMPAYLAGALSAGVVGWASIAVLMKLLVRGNLLPFALYCLALGSLSLLFLV